MRLHDKTRGLLALRPDVAVLPECACPEILLRRSPDLGVSDFAWTGPNPAKGLAALAFGPWRLTLAAGHNPKAATGLPLLVSGPARLRLLAVWALPRWAHRQWDRPPEPVQAVIEGAATFLEGSRAIIAGDFHQTLVRRRRDGTTVASPLARKLEGMGLVSAYHRSRGEPLGAERESTYYPYRRARRGTHADHVFVDPVTARALRCVEIGARPQWLSASDHVPLLVDLDDSKIERERRSGVE